MWRSLAQRRCRPGRSCFVATDGSAPPASRREDAGRGAAFRAALIAGLSLVLGGCFLVRQDVSQRFEQELGTPARPMRTGIYALTGGGNMRRIVVVTENREAYFINSTRLQLFTYGTQDNQYVFLLKDSGLAVASVNFHILGLAIARNESTFYVWVPQCTNEIRRQNNIAPGADCYVSSSGAIPRLFDASIRARTGNQPDYILEYIQPLPPA